MRNRTPLRLALLSLALLLVAGAWPAFSQTNPIYAWTTFVGQMGGIGNADGTGSAARFNEPQGVAVDSAGNVYVADYANDTIRKVTPTGVVTTLAGSPGFAGSADGTGSAARFTGPMGVAVDGAGNLFVADTFNHTIRKVTPAGVVTTLAGSARFSGTNDGAGSAARFFQPEGVTVDSAGNVFVADTYNCAIRKVTAAGVVTTLAGSAGSVGSADGTGSAARFSYPSDVAVDGAGNLFVADTFNHTIRKVTPARMVTTLAGSAGSAGSADGIGSAARFEDPQGVAVDSAGNVYVADYMSDTIRKVTPAGVVTTLAGSPGFAGSADGTGSAARFTGPMGVAADSAGNVFVAEPSNCTIRKVSAAGVVTTLAGSVWHYGSADGTGSVARFTEPEGVAVDIAGNIFVADSNNHAIRKVTAAGVVTTLAGMAGYYGSADGTGSAARFYAPVGVAVDRGGNVFVGDTWNSTIRKVTPAGAVTTMAGSARSYGSADGMGSAARFYQPFGVAVDSAGNVFVADEWNSTIRMVTAAGVVTTIGGVASVASGADGLGSAALFSLPFGIAVDRAGNLFVADTYNNAIRQGWPTSGGAGVTIIVPPQSLVTNAGATVTFSVAATGTGQLLYQWRFNGVNIPGATDVTLTLTDVQAPNAGDYGVVVASSLGSAASAAAQLFLLMQTNRQATVAEIGQSTIDPNSQLQVYTNGLFRNSVSLDPNRMTIVLTHGWNSSFRDWPAAMAPLFVLGSRTPTPNIVAWDWEKDAASELIHITTPISKIPAQGDALGNALLAALGPNYSQPIHFVGHSFGTLVNARAADYLHGDGAYPPAKGANAFLPANTQMTLFDEAELAPDSINDVLAATEAIITGVPVPIQPFYGSAMPKQSRWADSYISAVGLLHVDAANVILTKGLPGLEPDISTWWAAVKAFHDYPYAWYDYTVPVCSTGLMGDQWSFEQSGFASAPVTGSVFLQTAGVSPLDLAPTDMLSGVAVVLVRFEAEAASLGIAAGGSLGADSIVQVVGQVLGSVGSDLSSLYVRLQTGLGGLLGPNGFPPYFPKGGGGGGGTNAPAYAWIPLAVPSNAVSMSFEFMVQGDGQDDSFAVAVGGTNVLSLAMSLIQTNVTLSSGLIGVSPWAGQTVELFLGIVGGTSTNASLTAGGIAFYGLVPPSLQAQAYGSNLVVTWPVSADGYALETSTSLTGTNSWAPVTNLPAIVNFQNTVTNAISAGSRFYRLNKAP